MSPITWLQGPWAAGLVPSPLAWAASSAACSDLITSLPLPQVSVSLLCAPDLSSLRLPAELEPSWGEVLCVCISFLSHPKFPQAEVGSHQPWGAPSRPAAAVGRTPEWAGVEGTQGFRDVPAWCVWLGQVTRVGVGALCREVERDTPGLLPGSVFSRGWREGRPPRRRQELPRCQGLLSGEGSLGEGTSIRPGRQILPLGGSRAGLPLAQIPAGQPRGSEPSGGGGVQSPKCSLPSASSARCANSRKTSWNLLPPPQCRAERRQAPLPRPSLGPPQRRLGWGWGCARPRTHSPGARAGRAGASPGPLKRVELGRALPVGWALRPPPAPRSCWAPLASAQLKQCPSEAAETPLPVRPWGPGASEEQLPACPPHAGPHPQTLGSLRPGGCNWAVWPGWNSQPQRFGQIQCLFLHIHVPPGMAFCFAGSASWRDWEFLQGRSGCVPGPELAPAPQGRPWHAALTEEMLVNKEGMNE